MDGEVVVKVEGDESAAETAEETTGVVIGAAKEIAELIDDARQESAESAEEIRQVKYNLDDLWGAVSALNERVGIVIDLLTGVSDQVASLAALEVAEVLVEETPAKVEEVLDTAEAIADVTPQKEVVETAVTPQVRQKKQVKWL